MKTDYSVLDAAIEQCLRRGYKRALYDRLVNAVALPLAMEMRREVFRVIDGRLQALRKAGRITYSSKTGWSLVDKP